MYNTLKNWNTAIDYLQMCQAGELFRNVRFHQPCTNAAWGSSDPPWGPGLRQSQPGGLRSPGQRSSPWLLPDLANQNQNPRVFCTQQAGGRGGAPVASCRGPGGLCGDSEFSHPYPLSRALFTLLVSFQLLAAPLWGTAMSTSPRPCSAPETYSFTCSPPLLHPGACLSFAIFCCFWSGLLFYFCF